MYDHLDFYLAFLSLEYVNVSLDSNNTGSNTIGVNKWGVADENGIVAGESFAPENPTCTIL